MTNPKIRVKLTIFSDCGNKEIWTFSTMDAMDMRKKDKREEKKIAMLKKILVTRHMSVDDLRRYGYKTMRFETAEIEV